MFLGLGSNQVPTYDAASMFRPDYWYSPSPKKSVSNNISTGSYSVFTI